MKTFSDKFKELLVQQAARYEQTQPRAHVVPCKNCPSAHHPPDPECLDIKQLPYEERLQTAFPCGWNHKRYCKGYCDFMELNEADLKRVSR